MNTAFNLEFRLESVSVEWDPLDRISLNSKGNQAKQGFYGFISTKSNENEKNENIILFTTHQYFPSTKIILLYSHQMCEQ